MKLDREHMILRRQLWIDVYVAASGKLFSNGVKSKWEATEAVIFFDAETKWLTDPIPSLDKKE